MWSYKAKAHLYPSLESDFVSYFGLRRCISDCRNVKHLKRSLTGIDLPNFAFRAHQDELVTAKTFTTLGARISLEDRHVVVLAQFSSKLAHARRPLVNLRISHLTVDISTLGGLGLQCDLHIKQRDTFVASSTTTRKRFVSKELRFKKYAVFRFHKKNKAN